MATGWTVNVVAASEMLVLHQVLLMHLEILVTMEAFWICAMRPACQSVRTELWQNTEEQHCRFRTGSLVKFSLSANVINDTVFSLSYRSVLFECFFLSQTRLQKSLLCWYEWRVCCWTWRHYINFFFALLLCVRVALLKTWLKRNLLIMLSSVFHITLPFVHTVSSVWYICQSLILSCYWVLYFILRCCFILACPLL